MIDWFFRVGLKRIEAAVTSDVTAAIKDYSPAHLPVVKAIAVECGIIDTLNELLEWDEQQCNLSPADRLLALIMNALTEGQPMYRLPTFFEGTDVENLFGEGVEPTDLNNHACARALDKLADAGEKTVLSTVFLRAASNEQLSHNVLHADTTTFSVQGLYEQDDEDDTPLNITKGYNAGNNRQLKQFKAGLGVNRAGVPVIGQILDGNASDKTWNTELIGKLDEWIDTDQPPIYVGDSAVFTEKTLNRAAEHNIDIITRVPRNYNAVDALIDRAWEHDDWADVGVMSETRDEEDAASYKVQSFQQTFHDEHELRCVVVHSSSLDGRTERRIENELDDTEDDLEDAVGRLTDRSFECEADAHEALAEWIEDHDHRCFEIDTEVVETEEKKSRDGPGRPPKDWEPYKTVYKIAADVRRDTAAIEEWKSQQSCFVVATTLEKDEEWSDEAILTEYKKQQIVERRFPVLKDPKRVGPVFVERPDRVKALGNVLLIALLVYSVIERRARQALVDADEPMELAGGPTSFRPTGRRVLERFENMRVVEVDGTRVLPDNVDVPTRVLDFLDLSVEIYGVEDTGESNDDVAA